MTPVKKIFTIAALSILPGVAAADDGDAVLDAWLERQATIKTWSADVTQVRNLQSLVQPLKSAGEVVFSRPQRFRWQLGEPPRTLAIGDGQQLLIAYPRLRQVERYRHGATEDPALQQVIDLLEVGFPSDAAAFHARYELLDFAAGEDSRRFDLRPRSADARRLLAGIALEIDEDWNLVASEFRFPDGSTIRNEFYGLRIDEPVDDGLFAFEAGDGWQVSEPLAQ